MISKCGAGKDSWESLGQQGDQTSQSWRKSTLNIHWKDWCWRSNHLATWCEKLTHWKKPWCWERLRAEKEKGMTEDEMVGWHHWLNRHECELTLGDSEGQGNLACCNPWRRKELDRTEQRNNNKSPGRQMAPSIKSITHVGLIHSNQEWKKTPSESVFLGTDSDEAYTRDLKLGGD